MANLNSIFAQITALTLEEQRMLNKMLVSNINESIKESQRAAAVQFRVGDLATFDAGPRKGGKTTIQITSFSRDLSKIKGTQIGGMRAGIQWNVSANLAKKVA